jgi:thiol peroxidase
VSLDLPFALEPVLRRRRHRERDDGVDVPQQLRRRLRRDGWLTGACAGLFARSVVVLTPTARSIYTQVVPEIAQEPDYDAAVAALS